jgi:hypothetical protein
VLLSHPLPSLHWLVSTHIPTPELASQQKSPVPLPSPLQPCVASHDVVHWEFSHAKPREQSSDVPQPQNGALPPTTWHLGCAPAMFVMQS